MVIEIKKKFPPEKATYNVENLTPSREQLLVLYPDITSCQGCNICTKSCPQDIEVLRYMTAALCGEITEVAQRSFECMMCRLCAAKCPAGLPPYYIAVLCRRLRGRYLLPRAQHLVARVAEIEQGKFDAELEDLKKIEESELRRCLRELNTEA
jgi:ferredoxin